MARNRKFFLAATQSDCREIATKLASKYAKDARFSEQFSNKPD